MRRKSTFPWLMVTSLLVLLAVPIALAIYLLNSPDDKRRENPPSDSTTIGENDSGDRGGDSEPQPASSPKATPASGSVDFENMVGFGSNRSGWDLSKFDIDGELKSDGHSRIENSPSEHEDRVGPQTLRIRGDSKEVEFVPYDRKNSKLARIEFQAMRETNDLSKIAIEAKSTKRSEKWQEIVVLTDQINANGFSKVRISQEVLNKISNPQKFRFKIEGNKESGIYVDHLKIEFQ